MEIAITFTSLLSIVIVLIYLALFHHLHSKNKVAIAKKEKKKIDKIKTEKFEKKGKFVKTLKSPGAVKVYSSLICVALGLLIGFIVLIAINPSQGPSNFFNMITGFMFGGTSKANIRNLFGVLAKAAPLICVGLSVGFSFKTGMFNIGVAGQYVIGMFASLVGGIFFKLPWYLCILLAILAGGIYGAIPGLLKAKFNVNEVIGGIMLNWIALFFVNYSFQTYLKDCINYQQGVKTYTLASSNPSALIPDFGLKGSLGSYFSIAILIAIVVAIIMWFILSKTTLGYQLKASGYNKEATKYAGMNEKRNIVLSLAISGALAGLGASLYYLADIEQWQAGISNALPQMPWNGIVVAFIGQLNPIGIIFASIFTSMISHGARFMNQLIYPAEFGNLITGIIIYFSGLAAFSITLIRRYLDRRKKKKNDGG